MAGETKQRRQRRSFTDEFKAGAIRLVLVEGKSIPQVARDRGGSLWLVLTPDELVARLATLVPPPRVHAVRYHGVFAPNSKVRRRIVPQPASPPPPEQPAPTAAPVSASRGETPRRDPDLEPALVYRVPWADLLKKVF